MADYPFKINIQTKDGSKFSYFTASFATDATGPLSASAVSDRLLHSGLRAVQYTESIDAPAANVSADEFGHVNGGRVFLSSSFSHPNTGSISFTDTETTTNGGLDHYVFYGTKVCSVLGLPEGIKIRPENFRFSDDDNNPDNYMSGDLISDSIQLKQGFKMSPQARMRSNLVWDDLNGEGFIQWVSGSVKKAFMGYDPSRDFYSLLVSQITGSKIKATTFTGALSGNALTATIATNLDGGSVTLGEDEVIQSEFGNKATGDKIGHPLILSGSQNQLGNGGNVILQAGPNIGGSATNDADSIIQGGSVIARPGQVNLQHGSGLTELASSPGIRKVGTFRVEAPIASLAPILTIQNKMTTGIGSGTDLGFLNFDTYGETITGVVGFNNSGSEQSNQTIGQIKMVSNSTHHRGGGDRPTSMVFSVHDDGDHSAALNEVMRLVYQEATYQMQVTGSARVLGSLFVGDNDFPSATQGLIEAENDVIAFSSSDKRFKENLIPIKGSLDKLTSISGYEFDWIPNDKHHAYGDRHDVGVIAQEVEKVLPEVVQTRDSGFKAVKYEKMIPLLIEGIKEQQEQIDELKKEVEELKNA